MIFAKKYQKNKFFLEKIVKEKKHPIRSYNWILKL